MIAGIDIGSRAIKLVILDNGNLIAHKIVESSYEPHRQAEALLKEFRPHKIIATGYGRHFAKKFFAHDIITEIKAHSIGARYFYPKCMTIVDVGGQDTKVILLNVDGNVVNFQMNDKCAAGTGRFLEIMSISLGYEISDFGRNALNASENAKISSMCTVFAESEVISLKNNGIATDNIARAVHVSVVERIVSMLLRNGIKEDVVFTGGVANNIAIVKLLEEKLSTPIHIPNNPTIIGALGAALYGEKTKTN